MAQATELADVARCDHAGQPAGELGHQPQGQGVRRPEERQPGEQRGDLGGRAASERQCSRAAGQDCLADDLGRPGPAQEGQRRLPLTTGAGPGESERGGEGRDGGVPDEQAEPVGHRLVDLTKHQRERGETSNGVLCGQSGTHGTEPPTSAENSPDNPHGRRAEGHRPGEQGEPGVTGLEQQVAQHPADRADRNRSEAAHERHSGQRITHRTFAAVCRDRSGDPVLQREGERGAGEWRGYRQSTDTGAAACEPSCRVTTAKKR